MPSPVGTCGGSPFRAALGLSALNRRRRDACLPRTDGRFIPSLAFAAAAASGLRKDLKETIKLTPSLDGSSGCRRFRHFFFFFNINDVVISLFASDKGCLMHMNGLPRSKRELEASQMPLSLRCTRIVR